MEVEQSQETFSSSLEMERVSMTLSDSSDEVVSLTSDRAYLEDIELLLQQRRNELKSSQAWTVVQTVHVGAEKDETKNQPQSSPTMPNSPESPNKEVTQIALITDCNRGSDDEKKVLKYSREFLLSVCDSLDPFEDENIWAEIKSCGGTALERLFILVEEEEWRKNEAKQAKKKKQKALEKQVFSFQASGPKNVIKYSREDLLWYRESLKDPGKDILRWVEIFSSGSEKFRNLMSGIKKAPEENVFSPPSADTPVDRPKKYSLKEPQIPIGCLGKDAIWMGLGSQGKEITGEVKGEEISEDQKEDENAQVEEEWEKEEEESRHVQWEKNSGKMRRRRWEEREHERGDEMIRLKAFEVEGEPNFASGFPEDGMEFLRRVR